MTDQVNDYFRKMANKMPKLMPLSMAGGYLTAGEKVAVEAWNFSKRWESSMFETANRIPGDKESAEDYVRCLREAGVKQIAVTTDIALMLTLHLLVAQGLKVEDITQITRRRDGSTKVDAVIMSL